MTLAAGLASSGCNPLPWPPEDKLDEISRTIDASLDTMDADLAAAAAQIAQTGLDGNATRAALSSLCASYPDAADCATISPEAILVAVEPAAFHEAQGAYVGDQAHIIDLLQNHQPVMSGLFTAVEGFPALDFEYPLLADGAYAGSVSMLLKPADYFARLIGPLLEGTGQLCLVLQLDGVILYDADPGQVGRNTFTDPLYAAYTDLQQFAHRCVSQPAGVGTYEFTDGQTGEPVTKYARWTTVAFHGTEWRVVLINEGTAAN